MAIPKHLKGLVKGKPVSIGKWKVYEPSAKMRREIDKRIEEIKSGKAKSVPLDKFLKTLRRRKKRNLKKVTLVTSNKRKRRIYRGPNNGGIGSPVVR